MCCSFTARPGLWTDAGIAAAPWPWINGDDAGHLGFVAQLDAALDLPGYASCGAPDLDRDIAADPGML
jgi:hypothetical protein